MHDEEETNQTQQEVEIVEKKLSDTQRLKSQIIPKSSFEDIALAVK